jgi:RNA polymerase-binding transcription factor DksA
MEKTQMATAPAGPRTDLDLSEIRDGLTEERRRILADIEKLHAQDQTGGDAGETGELSDYDQHMADQGTELFLREQDEAIYIGLKNSLEQVEAALRKLDANSYGYCDVCGADIGAERLEFLPQAIHCIRCADEIAARF